MKNIHILQENIYITSDEEIKEGDYVYRDSGIVFKMTQELLEYYESRKDKDIHKRYKIILTTDQDLIKDDVRAINDTFLEWLVKNTSCESVEVDSWSDDLDGYWLKKYKIIIPSEEPKQELPKVGTKEFNDLASACFGGKPKQETLEEAEKYPIGGYAPGNYMCNCSICKIQFQGDKRAVQCEPCAIKMTKEEPKKEYKYIGECKGNNGNGCFMDSCGHDCGCFTIQERSYSEEEVKEILASYADWSINGDCTYYEWFEQFKNK